MPFDALPSLEVLFERTFLLRFGLGEKDGNTVCISHRDRVVTRKGGEFSANRTQPQHKASPLRAPGYGKPIE